MRRVIGPDVSFYQDDNTTPQGINFVRMNQVTDFVIIRAGQHLGADTDFRENWRRAKEAGLPRGSYWFYDSRADPRQQADLWYSLLAGDMGELPLFADLEEAYGGLYTGWRHWKTFLDRLKTLVGNKEIGIYTAYYYWQNNAPPPGADLEYFHQYPLWIANYGVDQPLVPRPWSANEWLFWQFTASGDGLYYGVESLEIDLNYFNGDPLAFARRFNVPVPEDPVPPEDPVGDRYRVTAGSLYVREGPGTNYPSIGFLVRNDIVEALASNPDGSWYRVRRLTDGLTGWSSATYLEKVTTPPPPPPPPPGDGDYYRVTAGTLYVRQGAGTNFPTVGYLVRNDVVEALEANSDGSWLRIRRLSDGLTGWSSAGYLEKITPPPPPPGDGDRYRVTARSLYVREGPGTNFPSIGYLVQNDIVEALESNSNGTWLRVRRLTDGLTGWSSATYLEKLSALPPPPPPSDDQRYRVTATRLHVRQGPGTEHPSLGYVELNEIVTAIGVNDDESWRQIKRSDGLTGWSSARYLVPYEVPTPDPNEPPPDADAGDWYQVTGARLNTREGPGVSFPSKGYLVRNEAVQAFSVSDDKKWVHFRRVDGMTGWASLTSLKKLGKTPASVMQKLFKGVTYYRNEKNSPRKVISHMLVIDTRTEGLRYLVTPPVRDTPPQLCSRTVSQFLAEQGVQIAVNADGFRYFEPDQFPPDELCPGGGDPVSPLSYAASRGKVYSEKEPGTPILYINQNNQISIDKPVGKVYNAIAGDVLLVTKGKKVSGLDKTLPNPRTAFGMNQNGRWVYLVVVDGRSTSKGLTFDELADLLIENGAYSGIALDGGGSSTMVVEGVDGLPRVLNTPINEGIPGKQRAIANHLGIAFKK